MAEFWGELFGTCLLVTLGCGVNANQQLKQTYGQGTTFLMGCVGWGLAVGMSVYAVGRISGAHLNPAVSVGMLLIGQLEWQQLPVYVAGQMVGAMLGAVLVAAAYASHWAVTDNAAAKLGVFSTAPGIRSARANVFCEALGTAVLVFGVLAIAANAGEMRPHGQMDLSVIFSSGINPLLVGLLVSAIGIGLGGPTGYAINPARDLGPRIVHAVLPIHGKGGSNWSYAWVPVIGPLLGGVAGAVLFELLEHNTK